MGNHLGIYWIESTTSDCFWSLEKGANYGFVSSLTSSYMAPTTIFHEKPFGILIHQLLHPPCVLGLLFALVGGCHLFSSKPSKQSSGQTFEKTKNLLCDRLYCHVWHMRNYVLRDTKSLLGRKTNPQGRRRFTTAAGCASPLQHSCSLLRYCHLQHPESTPMAQRQGAHTCSMAACSMFRVSADMLTSKQK